jgi:hypothetical protein
MTRATDCVREGLESLFEFGCQTVGPPGGFRKAVPATWGQLQNEIRRRGEVDEVADGDVDRTNPIASPQCATQLLAGTCID